MTKTELLKITKPILFNTEMVKAILDGRKTVTRRVVKLKDNRGIWEPINNCRNHEYGANVPCYLHREISVDDYSPNIVCPKIDVGDYLYVRETWCTDEDMADVFEKEITHGFYYKAGEIENDWVNDKEIVKWKPSIYMPKSAARIFLKVTDVRVERLQEITVEQAIKEGFEGIPCGCCMTGCTDCYDFGWREPPQVGFMYTWDSTIKKQDLDKYGWDANPWVWVYEFERIEI